VGATIAGTLAVQLPAAELFYVSADMTDLARHAANTLTDYRLHPEDLPAQIGVMVYEHPPVEGTAVWVGDRGRGLRRGHHDEVVVRLSSVLFVKSGGRVVARVLSEDEIRLLVARPELLRGPTEILAQRDIAPTNGAPVVEHHRRTQRDARAAQTSSRAQTGRPQYLIRQSAGQECC
jgi:hypothetical protein